MSKIENETPAQQQQRKDLEQFTYAVAKALAAMIHGTGCAFTLILADLGAKGSMAYASTGVRADVILMLREMLEKLEIQAAADAAQAKRGSS